MLRPLLLPYTGGNKEKNHMTKQIWLAALTATFIAGGMAVAHAQAGGGGAGGGGGAAAGGGDGGGAAAGSDPSQVRPDRNPSPIYKDERYTREPGMPR